MINEKKSIDTLKKLVIQSDDLSKPMHYFFDLMDDNIILNMKGHRIVKHPQKNNDLLIVMQAIENETSQYLGCKIRVAQPMFQELPMHNFFHGTCLLQDHSFLLVVIYFSDVQSGIFSIARGMTQNEIFRFSFVKKEDLKTTYQ